MFATILLLRLVYLLTNVIQNDITLLLYTRYVTLNKVGNYYFYASELDQILKQYQEGNYFKGENENLNCDSNFKT